MTSARLPRHNPTQALPACHRQNLLPKTPLKRLRKQRTTTVFLNPSPPPGTGRVKDMKLIGATSSNKDENKGDLLYCIDALKPPRTLSADPRGE
jgi:hypothetical protein